MRTKRGVGCARRPKHTRRSTAKRRPRTLPSEEGASQWPLWEVFSQGEGGAPHEHVGSLHAADAEMALQNARDVYARRGPVVSLWVVPSAAITASPSDEAGPFFDPGADKIYRHPQFYKVPRGLKGF